MGRKKSKRLLVAVVLALGISAALAATACAQPFTVTNLSDSGTAGDGSLRGEVKAANANPGADTIDFAPGLAGTITLSGGLLITDPVDLEGPGPSQITVAQSGPNRVLHIELPIQGEVTIAGLHIADGSAPNTGAFPIGSGADILSENSNTALTIVDSLITGGDAAEGGGGIDSEGSLTLVSSTVSGNHAKFYGGVLARAGFTIEDSTISGNAADGGDGGIYGQQVTGTGVIDGSTISGNTAHEAAGVDLNAVASAHIRVSDSTVSGNTASGNGGGIFMSTAPSATISIEGSTISGNASGGDGGGLRSYATLALGDTIVAGNTAANVGPDIYTSSAHSLSTAFSLIGDPAGETNTETVAGSDLLGVDPQLGPLADNGGPTQTMAPAPGSPAVNQGSAFGLAADQRGSARPVLYPGVPISSAPGADGADIGAVELQAPPVVNPPPPASPSPPPQTAPKGPPRVRVSCPKSAKPGGCKFKLQVFSAKPAKPNGRGKRAATAPIAESAVARVKLGAGKSALVTLTPKPPFAAKLAAATKLLVRETVTEKGETKTVYRKLTVVG